MVLVESKLEFYVIYARVYGSFLCICEGSYETDLALFYDPCMCVYISFHNTVYFHFLPLSQEISILFVDENCVQVEYQF